MQITSFAPIETTNANLLILGSMPGEISLQRQQYYAHPRNAFWQIMESICNMDANLSYEEKVIVLKDRGIAVWDVLQHCKREGSLDIHIKTDSEISNDFKGFLLTHPRITQIFFNGQKAEKSFRKFVWPKLPSNIKSRIRLISLPSTSPANTRLTWEERQAEWICQISKILE